MEKSNKTLIFTQEERCLHSNQISEEFEELKEEKLKRAAESTAKQQKFTKAVEYLS